MRIRKPDERWFQIENDPDNARVKIKHLTPGEIQDIVDDAYQIETVYVKNEEGKLSPKMRQNHDRRLDRESTLKACIVDWENFYDENGNKLECNEDNIIRAAREIDNFTALIDEFRETLSNDISEEKEEQEKN
jgi:hypothetical protein